VSPFLRVRWFLTLFVLLYGQCVAVAVAVAAPYSKKKQWCSICVETVCICVLKKNLKKFKFILFFINFKLI
jgi:hypothetical protein